MPSSPRTRRTGAGPGRGRSRPRSAARPVSEQRGADDPQVVSAQRTAESRPAHRSVLTWRALALILVLAVLVISYASSLKVYLETERQQAELRQQIETSQQHLDQLNSDLIRWENPDYVRAQARERLGWVVPGEVGYRVIGPDGQPVGTRIENQPKEEIPAPAKPWWGNLWGGIQAADHPAPPGGAPPLTDGSGNKPTPTPSPTKTRTR